MNPSEEKPEGQTIAEMVGIPKPDLSGLVPDVEIVAMTLDVVSSVVDLGEVAVSVVAAIGEGLSNIDLG
jgi:hypothetical protein